MSISKNDVRSKTQARRGLRRVEAAIHVGVSPTKFDEMVKDGRIPRPKRIDAIALWDQRQLDLAFEALPDDDSRAENPWDLFQGWVAAFSKEPRGSLYAIDRRT